MKVGRRRSRVGSGMVAVYESVCGGWWMAVSIVASFRGKREAASERGLSNNLTVRGRVVGRRVGRRWLVRDIAIC